MFEVGEQLQTVSARQELINHLESVASDNRATLADDWDADDDSPEALADAWLDHPDDIAEYIVGGAQQANCLAELAQLVLEHSLPLEPSWFEPRARIPLANLGLLPDIERQDTFIFPAAIAAALAPYIDGRRPSLAVLLGRADEQRIDNLLDEYDLPTDGSRLRRVERLIDKLQNPNRLQAVVERLPNPDWLGPAVMILELGGTCYWREIFGVEAEGQQGGDNVVALMGNEQRDRERDIADRLTELGVVFRLDADEPWPMIAVPEELWSPIWQTGRNWIAEWLHVTHHDLQAATRNDKPDRDLPDFQQVSKWLACEVSTGDFHADDDMLDDDATERLDASADDDLSELWPRVWSLATDASILTVDGDGEVELGRDANSMLDASGREIARGLLYEWCTNYVGTAADQPLAQAWGLDESWRQEALELLRARHEFVPTWFHQEGVQPENTGAGCLRSMDEDRMELTLQEFELLTGMVWTAKLLWLDLLSLLEPNKWYHATLFSDLLRMSAAMSVFSRIGDLVHDPRAYFYLPVQRPSLLNSPMHLDEFDEWTSAILDRLLEPLGIIQIDDVDRTNYEETLEQGEQTRAPEGPPAVWLAESLPIVDSPAGWPTDERKNMLEFILGEDIEWNDDPTGRGHHLSAVETDAADEQGERVDLAADLQHLLDRVDGRHIRACNGDTLWLE